MTNLVKVVARAGRKIVRPVIKTAQKVKTNKPEIFLAVGLSAAFASLVWVAVESMKAPDVMTDDANAMKCLQAEKTEIESGQIRLAGIDSEDKEARILTDKEQAELIRKIDHDIRIQRLNGIWHMSRLYIGPLILFLFGRYLIVNIYNIISK